MPLAVTLAGCLMLFCKKDYFHAFVEGAKEGLGTTVRLLPTLVALLVAISMLNASGLVGCLSHIISPIASVIGIPPDLLPLLLTRPFSGSASAAAYSTLLSSAGADSFTGLCASVIYGSSDTVVYVISIYTSSVGIRKTRYAFPCAFAVMIFCIFFSCFLCRLCFL